MQNVGRAEEIAELLLPSVFILIQQ
jgi:hypothetical protein